MDDNARFLAALSFSAFVVIKLTVIFPPLFWAVCDLFAVLLVVRVVLVPAAAVAASCVSSGLLPGLSYESIVEGKIRPHIGLLHDNIKHSLVLKLPADVILLHFL